VEPAPGDGRTPAAVAIGATVPLGIDDVVAVARGRRAVVLDEHAYDRIAAARRLVDAFADEDRVVYGLTTGFGSLSRVRIPHEDLVELQHNLLASHAAGVGEPLPAEVVRAMMLLLCNSLAKGHSGVRAELVERILVLLDRDVIPVVPSRGSVGASGDLAPLAHLALAVCGEGRFDCGGEIVEAAAALARAGLEPSFRLAPKEGLALVNGTHLMAGLGALLVHDTRALLAAAELAAALSLDVLLGSVAAFDDRVHALRRRPRQREVAARLRSALGGSGLLASHAECGKVQDPYTLRCIPQVLGAAWEGFEYVEGAIALELDAVTDNPLCFPDDDAVLAGGNFHGQPLALPLDALAVLVAEVAAFSERRSYRLLGERDDGDELQLFLTPEPGNRSGLMLLQYVAASLVAENHVLAQPAGLASLPTSAGVEDFNSLGATAALKARQVLDNALRVVAIELLCAAQALDLRRPLRSSTLLERLHERLRSLSPVVDRDRPLAEDIDRVAAAIREGTLADLVPDADAPRPVTLPIGES
jgi:histidine ammonia-lyase